MKAVIFAGGVGTRLWPLSRKNSPKQFEKVIDDKSTLQLTIDILQPEIKTEDIYIATGIEYVDLVRAQLNTIPPQNILGEPHRKDVGPAVALVMGILAKKFPNEPVVVLWSDHWIRKVDKFKKILTSTDLYLTKNPERMIFFWPHSPICIRKFRLDSHQRNS
ncbi:MAG: Alginate biosynthesis protein AlgA [Microgenomates bacterium OLB23]|nr:MAG: Alginate biosynthesis protein AlgA [Microgenomates bacterium OLB23]